VKVEVVLKLENGEEYTAGTKGVCLLLKQKAKMPFPTF
jgi:hypothetical protein